MSLIDSEDSLLEIKDTVLQTLNRAGNDRKSAFRFIVLNTILNGFPNSRYVVLRKFDKETHELFIYTDFRSNKIAEIKQNEMASVLAYDKQKKFQIKISARTKIHHQDEIAERHWDTLAGGKEAYNTVGSPGKEVKDLDKAHLMKDEFDSDHFAVLVLKVSKIEALQLDSKGHIRTLFDIDNDHSSFLIP
jgi:general stress protein 26